MITRTDSRWQTKDWHFAMKNMIRTLDELCRALDLSISDLGASYQAERDFPVRVPQSYLQLIEKGNARDPLLLQVLPQTVEMDDYAGFEADPLQEAAFNKVPGLIHKYHGRVLLITTPSCAIHCRYCFRRHFSYDANTPGSANWQEALDYIRSHPAIHEVILSGGDPLAGNDAYLEQLITRIAAIPHIRTLRLHSRLPTAMPQRITNELLRILTGTRLKVVMVLHVNHARELGGDAGEAVALLRSHGVRLLNQSVLLKGVNDSVPALLALLEELHRLDIQAYYLHLLDHVRGTGHFLVPDHEATALYRQLSALLPGYLLPRLVREKPHENNKIAVM